MNYSDKHSHKWSKIMLEGLNRAKKVNALKDAGEAEKAAVEFQKLYKGDFSDQTPEKIFPGLLIMGPYWRSVQGEMECRFDCMTEYAKMPEMLKANNFNENTDKFYNLFMDDVKEILNNNEFLSWERIEKLNTDGINSMMLPEDWVGAMKPYLEKLEEYSNDSYLPLDFLEDWYEFCLRGVIAYDYILIKQSLFCINIVKEYGKEKLLEVLNKSKEDFGWRVSKLFFVDMFPKSGIPDHDLMVLGRYSMFCDQYLETSEKEPEKGKEETEPKIKTTTFYNCQEFSIFDTVAHHMGVPLTDIGIGVCLYCEEHARKTSDMFTPPSMKPELRMEESFGFGNDRCLCKTILYPEPDMERFMNAQDKVFNS